MSDVVVVYIAGQEMARGRANKQGHVHFNQQTYQNTTDFYNDAMAKNPRDMKWWTRSVTKSQYKACYKTALAYMQKEVK